MDEISKSILNHVDIFFEKIEDLDGIFIPREQFLNPIKYEELKDKILELKQVFSSSFLTSLQSNACKNQKWPLLNLIRQILQIYNFEMEPIRKCDGYTLNGVKKFKRFFLIKKINPDSIKNKDKIMKN